MMCLDLTFLEQQNLIHREPSIQRNFAATSILLDIGITPRVGQTSKSAVAKKHHKQKMHPSQVSSVGPFKTKLFPLLLLRAAVEL